MRPQILAAGALAVAIAVVNPGGPFAQAAAAAGVSARDFEVRRGIPGQVDLRLSPSPTGRQVRKTPGLPLSHG